MNKNEKESVVNVPVSCFTVPPTHHLTREFNIDIHFHSCPLASPQHLQNASIRAMSNYDISLVFSNILATARIKY